MKVGSLPSVCWAMNNHDPPVGKVPLLVVIPCKVGVVKEEYLSVLDGPVSWAGGRPMVKVGQSRCSSISTWSGKERFRAARRPRVRRPSQFRRLMNAIVPPHRMKTEDVTCLVGRVAQAAASGDENWGEGGPDACESCFAGTVDSVSNHKLRIASVPPERTKKRRVGACAPARRVF